MTALLHCMSLFVALRVVLDDAVVRLVLERSGHDLTNESGWIGCG